MSGTPPALVRHLFWSSKRQHKFLNREPAQSVDHEHEAWTVTLYMREAKQGTVKQIIWAPVLSHIHGYSVSRTGTSHVASHCWSVGQCITYMLPWQHHQLGQAGLVFFFLIIIVAWDSTIFETGSLYELEREQRYQQQRYQC
jgi:cyanate permease